MINQKILSMTSSLQTESISMINIYNLFSFSKDFFIIPSYQRKFAWEFKEIKELIDDVILAMENDYTYNLGTILLAKNDKFSSSIIDGQQRLTVLFFIILALCKYSNDEYFSKNIFLRRLNVSDSRSDEIYHSKIINHDKTDLNIDYSIVDEIISYFESKGIEEESFSDYLFDNITVSAHYLHFYDNTPSDVIELICLQRFINLNKKGKRLIDAEVLNAENHLSIIQKRLNI